MTQETAQTAKATNLSGSNASWTISTLMEVWATWLDSEDLDLNFMLLLTGCVTLSKVLFHL